MRKLLKNNKGLSLIEVLVTVVIFLMMALTLVVFTSSAAKSEDAHGYKCYVEYFGGGDGIQLTQFENSSVSSVKARLKNREVHVGGSIKTKTIYKVGECVKRTESFTMGRAQLLDKELPH